MPIIRRGLRLAKSMTQDDAYHLLVFDPGGTTGWARFVVDYRAFSRPEHKVLSHVRAWDCGEVSGDELAVMAGCVEYIHCMYQHARPGNTRYAVVIESFELSQLKGGQELLSPVRITAVISWMCASTFGIPVHIQHRNLRVGVTRDHLRQYGFGDSFRKDEFAAMQHAITWLRRLKRASHEAPWRVNTPDHPNAHDCACRYGKHCDLKHPK